MYRRQITLTMKTVFFMALKNAEKSEKNGVKGAEIRRSLFDVNKISMSGEHKQE